MNPSGEKVATPSPAAGLDLLRSLDDSVARCIKCGFCQAVCPIYRETREENGAARGKMSLVDALLDGRATPNRRLADLLSRCVLCKTCAHACPSGVPTDRVFIAARSAVVSRIPPSYRDWPKAMALSVLSHRGWLNALMRIGARLYPLFFRRSGLARWPLSGFEPLRGTRLPRPSARTFLELTTGLEEQDPERNREISVRPDRKTALFWPGCVINYAYPETGLSSVEILRRLGYRVVFPSTHRCCGIPLAVNGRLEEARETAKSNVLDLGTKAFDLLVTACPSCAGAFDSLYPELLAGTPQAATAESIAAKTKHLVDFDGLAGLAASGEQPQGTEDRPITVTYHDPCHLIHNGHSPARPRGIIARLPALRLVELGDPGSCCGGGGTFAFFHRHLSNDIGLRKVCNIKATKAEVVATACPGCVMQLRETTAAAGYPARVVHLADLVVEALREQRPSAEGWTSTIRDGATR